MADKFEACPFCGATSTKDIHSDCYLNLCEFSGDQRPPQDLIMRRWSKRPIEDALKARIAELETENTKQKAQIAKNKELLAHARYKLLTVSELDSDTIKRRTECAEKANAERRAVVDLMVKTSGMNDWLTSKLRFAESCITDLEATLAGVQAQAASRDQLFEQIIEAGEYLAESYRKNWTEDDEPAHPWRWDALVAEWQAMKGGE